MTDEASYIAGHKAAWRHILGDALRELHGDDLAQARAVAELHDTRVQLRLLFEEVGDRRRGHDRHTCVVSNGRAKSNLPRMIGSLALGIWQQPSVRVPKRRVTLALA